MVHLTRFEGGKMQMTIWHLDGVERAVVESCQVALDVDRSMSVDEPVPSFRVNKNQFFTKVSRTQKYHVHRDERGHHVVRAITVYPIN